MIREFEGKTEQEAINKAIEELHIERDDFDVEVVDNGRRGLFKKGNVKIRVNVDSAPEEETPMVYEENEDVEEEEETLEQDSEFEEKVCSFLEGVVSRMGYECKAVVTARKGRKVCISLEGDNSNIIIGRKGKNLDAFQIIANVFAGRLDSGRKIIVDAEGYRTRHEDQIIKEAFRTAQQVRKTGRSRLLEPMNPYERRLVHTALNDVTGIETKSEGEGLYKQVRIISKREYR